MEKIMTRNEIQGYAKPIAQRAIEAQNKFVEVLKLAAPSLTDDEAVRISGFYQEHKIAKLDHVLGKISVKHGAYLEEETLLRARDMVNENQTKIIQ